MAAARHSRLQQSLHKAETQTLTSERGRGPDPGQGIKEKEESHGRDLDQETEEDGLEVETEAGGLGLETAVEIRTEDLGRQINRGELGRMRRQITRGDMSPPSPPAPRTKLFRTCKDLPLTRET